jgi:hypothetical protein
MGPPLPFHDIAEVLFMDDNADETVLDLEKCFLLCSTVSQWMHSHGN